MSDEDAVSLATDELARIGLVNNADGHDDVRRVEGRPEGEHADDLRRVPEGGAPGQDAHEPRREHAEPESTTTDVDQVREDEGVRAFASPSSSSE